MKNTERVKHLYDAFAAGDAATVMGALSPEIVWNEAENFPYADGNPYVGPDAVAQGVFARLGSEWDYWNLADLQIFGMDNDMVLATGRYQGKLARTGGVLDAQFAHLWTFRDGKVHRFSQFTDTKQASDIYSA